MLPELRLAALAVRGASILGRVGGLPVLAQRRPKAADGFLRELLVGDGATALCGDVLTSCSGECSEDVRAPAEAGAACPRT